jgi:uncharacterized protein YutE (UPF0331/DUF86 family)
MCHISTIQCVLDISNHVIADLRLNLPADNKGLFEMLVDHKILGKMLAKRLTAMAGFRDILVQEYLEIDRRPCLSRAQK